jgi:peptidoglycan/LPS O-acetylase OafA/YrhL
MNGEDLLSTGQAIPLVPATGLDAPPAVDVPASPPIEPRLPARREIRALTGIRAMACFWVLAFHLHEYFPHLFAVVDAHSSSRPLHEGFLGVDLFFLLSGFILSYTYDRPGVMTTVDGYFRFLGLRLARIYPVHLVTLLAMVPFGFEIHKILHAWPIWASPRLFVASIFLVNSWSVPVIGSWNVPAWSVSAEWFAYLLFPAYLLVTRRLKTPAVALGFIAGCVVVLIGLCRSFSFTVSSPYGMLRIALEFPIGSAMYQLYRMNFGEQGLRSGRADLAVLVGIAGVYAVSESLPGQMGWQVFCVPFLALVLYGVSWGRGFFAWFLATPVLEFGGRASYAVYMVQFPCLLVLHRFLVPKVQSPGIELVYCLLYLGVISLVGIAVHHWIEEPTRLYCRDITRRLGTRPT